MTQIWLRGFKLATNHYFYHSNYFWIDIFLKNGQKMCASQQWWKLPFGQLIVSQIKRTSNTKYPEERILLIFICSKVTAQTTQRVLILLWPITLRHLTRRKKCDDFWLPGAESFPMVYNMNDFAAIIFRRYYTLSGI